MHCDTMCASSLSISGTSSEHRGAFIDDVDIPHCIDALSVREIVNTHSISSYSVYLDHFWSISDELQCAYHRIDVHKGEAVRGDPR